MNSRACCSRALRILCPARYLSEARIVTVHANANLGVYRFDERLGELSARIMRPSRHDYTAVIVSAVAIWWMGGVCRCLFAAPHLNGPYSNFFSPLGWEKWCAIRTRIFLAAAIVSSISRFPPSLSRYVLHLWSLFPYTCI